MNWNFVRDVADLIADVAELVQQVAGDFVSEPVVESVAEQPAKRLREFKVGDTVWIRGEIQRMPDSDGDLKVIFESDAEVDWSYIPGYAETRQ